MRRILVAAAVMVGVLGVAACQPPAPTLTATPSTLKPECEAITTVTGKLTPSTTNREVVIQTQRDGKWINWFWWKDTSSGKQALTAPVDKTTGAYSVAYLAPNRYEPATVRLRMHTTYNRTTSIVSKSWYVTRPSGC